MRGGRSKVSTISGNEVPNRPVLRYHGGKWRLAPWIISHFPKHQVYVEPFGGAASILLRKPRSKAEVYNDLDEDVVNVFHVLRDPEQAQRLAELCYLTPWSRTEFWLCYEEAKDPIERARRTIARSFMAHGSTHRRAHRTGFRSRNWRQRNPAPRDWENYPQHIQEFVERLRGVTIECRPAIEVIKQQDSPETLFYVDPPYILSSRSSIRSHSEADGKRCYVHNLSDDDHAELADVLRSCQGMIVLSGYNSEFYQKLYSDWRHEEKEALVDGGRYRTEFLWLSPNIPEKQLHLFADSEDDTDIKIGGERATSRES